MREVGKSKKATLDIGFFFFSHAFSLVSLTLIPTSFAQLPLSIDFLVSLAAMRR